MSNTPRKRSGGPKTAEGKQLVSRNSLKTGAYSQMVVLPGEDEQAFNELQHQFLRDFAPQDVAETCMVHDLAILTWKKLRLDQLEHAGLLRELNAPFKFSDCMEDPFKESALDRFRELGDALDDLIDAYRRTRVVLSGDVEGKEFTKLLKQFPLLEAFVEQEASEFDGPVARDQWLTETINFADGTSMPFPKYVLESFIEHWRELDWLFDNPDKARNRIREIQNSRLLKFIERKDLGRVRDDLNRAFYKTLSELRRHQGWRQQTREITVNPTDSTDTPGEKEPSSLVEAMPTPSLWGHYP